MAGARLKGSGALFKNTRKTNDNHPDFTGKFKMSKDLLKSYIEAFKKDPNVVELEVEVAGWSKQSRNGEYISLSVNAPFEKTAPAKNAFDDPPF